MPDREKVIEGLQHCIRGIIGCQQECPYKLDVGCRGRLITDALELLKEQEPVAPRKVKRYIEYSNTAVNFIDAYDCGNCGAELPDNSKYCPACGRAVNLNATD